MNGLKREKHECDADTVSAEGVIGVCSPSTEENGEVDNWTIPQFVLSHSILSLIVSLSFVYYALSDCPCHC